LYEGGWASERVLATMFLVVIAGAVQVEVDQKDFTTFWDGVWWAV
jgi:hypothetical protein